MKISANKKKVIVLSVMMGLLILTGFINLSINQTEAVVNTSTNVVSGNFFTNYRSDRDSARDQEKLYYSAILESASSTSEAKSNATNALSNIAALVESELYLESNIKAKGFSDVIVSMSNNFVNVMVSADSLTDAQVAQIVQVVQEQTNKSIDNIKIIPVE
ncbi:MAG: SpoIIIAH-like family protein [Clostridia bacterium]|nr:SpoIIIAH-like family protein [Clostridia bacterium]